MIDPAVIIATLGTCIALLSAAMSWIALRHSTTAWRSHQRLHKEFWRQSLVQADHNSKAWRAQTTACEQLAFVLNHLSLAPLPPSDKPPDVPLN